MKRIIVIIHFLIFLIVIAYPMYEHTIQDQILYFAICLIPCYILYLMLSLILLPKPRLFRLSSITKYNSTVYIVERDIAFGLGWIKLGDLSGSGFCYWYRWSIPCQFSSEESAISFIESYKTEMNVGIKKNYSRKILSQKIYRGRSIDL